MPGLVLVPKHARVGASTNAACHAVLHVPVIQHRACRAEQSRDAHADGPHHGARRGLVATRQQHHAIAGQAAQQLFDFHRQKVAIQHGGGLDHDLAQAHGRQLDGIASGHQNALLDRLSALAQMGVAGRQIAPGVDDGYHGFVHHIFAPCALLLHALTMRKAPHASVAKPAAAAKLRELFHRLGCLVGHPRCGHELRAGELRVSGYVKCFC